jgi:hypothetical protein
MGAFCFRAGRRPLLLDSGFGIHIFFWEIFQQPGAIALLQWRGGIRDSLQSFVGLREGESI